MGVAAQRRPVFANYLPDELLLEVLEYVSQRPATEAQCTLATFCRVSRQWYNVGIQKLYESPVLAGMAYDLFVRTVCPSLNAHIKKSDLAGLVKVLDLSLIVHQGNKATTARLLNRTRDSLERFAAPQSSFGTNCWAALAKCTRLRVLDLSLVSEAISYNYLAHTLGRLPSLRKLYLPRCSSHYTTTVEHNHAVSGTAQWPPLLAHLQISGKMHVGLRHDLLQLKHLESLGFSHCPGIQSRDIRDVVTGVSDSLTALELSDIPGLSHGSLDHVLNWATNLKRLRITLDYLSIHFCVDLVQKVPEGDWQQSKPLERLTLMSSGQRADPDFEFSALDLVDLIEKRWLGRLRFLDIEETTGWLGEDEGELDELEKALDELDKENWLNRRWHYEQFDGRYKNLTWEQWVETEEGRRMRPRMRLLKGV